VKTELRRNSVPIVQSSSLGEAGALG